MSEYKSHSYRSLKETITHWLIMKRSNFLLFAVAITVLASASMNCLASSAKEKNSKVMTQGISHLGLTVKDLTASTNFFVNILGWKNVGGYPDYPSAFVTDGNLFLTLWQTKPEKKTIEFNRKYNVGLHHLALKVSSLDVLHQLHKRFQKTDGVVIEFAPEPNGGGPTIHMMIREPSGNRLEFAFTPKRK